MKIIAGIFGRRNFEAPHGHKTHPMSEKVRGAMFNILGDIGGLSVLDCFAGSGALSFEAISRGALHVTAIDIDKNAYEVIRKSAVDLGVSEKIKTTRANIGGWSDNNPGLKFDLVLVDPPHDDLQPKHLQKLVKHVRSGGLYVLSWPGKLGIPNFPSMVVVESKNYGDAQLVFYRRIK